MKLKNLFIVFSLLGVSVWYLCAESFVVKRKKTLSASKLKEQYADELTDLIRLIPQLQKQLAHMQEQLIDELAHLVDNDLQVGKSELDSRVDKAKNLLLTLQNEYNEKIPAHTCFLRSSVTKDTHSKA